jgi:peptidoglycan/xylan/chitin deacetylase (PgdA/CDA1 family)
MTEYHIKKISNIYKKSHLPVGRAKKFTSAILVYHGVAEHIQKNCISIEQFREHLNYLEKEHVIVKLSELVERIQTGQIDRNYVVLTFDDAYLNVYEHAYPELAKRKLPAIIFIPANYIGLYNVWDYDRNPAKYPYLQVMARQELGSLDPQLIEFGSHSLSHSRMKDLARNELEKEIKASKMVLEQNLGREIRFFAFPYGQLTDFDSRALEFLKNSGYSGCCTTHFSRFNDRTDPYLLNRISVWAEDQADDLENKLSGYYDWLTGKEILVNNLSMLKVFKNNEKN